MSIKESLATINQNIQAACARANRQKDEVCLIAVSKTKPIPLLEEAYALGIRDFGENRVQELEEKAINLPKDIRWHMIGHLQKNKVKQAVRYASLIHSVDSLSLAQVIHQEAYKQGKIMPVLLEINVAEEETKFGYSIASILDDIKEIASLSNLSIKGLMTVAPFTLEEEQNRIFFQQLKQLSVDIMAKNIDNISMNHLSMGMSSDYSVAIEEGATMVRIGTSLFGKR